MPARPGPAVMWFRRDLRLGDNPALLAACSAAGDAGVVALFVLDPALWGPAGPSRRCHLVASLRALHADLRERGGALVVRHGESVHEVPRCAAEVGAATVHVSEDFGPYGRRRDEKVAGALAATGVTLVPLGSPYAVAPGRVRNAQGDPYQVFTPFSRAWAEHGWRPPVGAPDVPCPPSSRSSPSSPSWLIPPGDGPPEAPRPEGITLPAAGERAALARWGEFLEDGVDDYDRARNLPAQEGTSQMSVHLKWGEIHPRTMLADLAARGGTGAATFRSELAWREFYADVLARRPDTARGYLKPELSRMAYDEPGEDYAAWTEGRTGFPVVDAGMRQLRATGWMHNRLRMIVASFLVKDLHVEWQHGARHFMRWLVDGDLASNQHGWQWVAGSGTDAAPYFRVFNPTTQGRRFDPDGDYVRRWVPELREVATRYVHEPYADPAGAPAGYPAPIVDHARERREALARYQEITGGDR